MAKALGNREVSLGPESRTPQLTEEDALRTGSGRVQRGPQKVQQMPARFAEEGQSVAGKATEWKETAEETIQDLKERADETLSNVRQSTSAAYEESNAKVRDVYENVRQRSEEAARRVRVRARYLSDEYPMQVVATVAGVAFLVGVLLRVWRSRSL
jgi:ElaB/YqjD/DUF883 family membrane-anchored ribosome-binding protein